MAVGCALSGNIVFAHDAWTEQRNDHFVVVFGHKGKMEKYAPSKVRKVSAIDAAGRSLATNMEKDESVVRFSIAGKPALTLLHYDNGFWTKTTDGLKSGPKNGVHGALHGTHAVKYGKTVHAWTAAASVAQGQELEIVPLESMQPAAGGTLPLQVLWQGKPLAGAKIFRVDAPHLKPVEANSEGKTRFALTAERQILSVSHKKNLINDPQADEYSVSATLVFDVR